MDTKLFRICTEHKPNLPELVAARFDSFYITTGVGYWKGQSEVGATIDIITNDRPNILRVASDIKHANLQ